MIRSTDEWLMSLSFQSATSSNAATTCPRITRASPHILSQMIGLRLCGIADDPVCPLPNGSSTSRISVRCRLLNSVANFSNDAPTRANVIENSAWMSR